MRQFLVWFEAGNARGYQRIDTNEHGFGIDELKAAELTIMRLFKLSLNQIYILDWKEFDYAKETGKAAPSNLVYRYKVKENV